MPPIEPPATANTVSMPRWSSSIACARTMSRMVMTGKSRPQGIAGRRMGRGRAGGAHAGAEHIGADDEIAVGVDRLAGADHGLPPAGLAGHGMAVEDVLVAGQRMADQHGVAARGIERAVGLVGDLERAERHAGIELERLVRRRTGRAATAGGPPPAPDPATPRPLTAFNSAIVSVPASRPERMSAPEDIAKTKRSGTA